MCVLRTCACTKKYQPRIASTEHSNWQNNEEDEVADVYLVHLGLPTGHIVRNVQAAFTPSRDYDFVIGMDVITQGDFAITNKDNQTVFSYQRPAQEHIRFEER